MVKEEKTKKANSEKTKLVTPEFRVSYPHLFKPQRVKPTDKPKYSITMMFPKNADLTKIKDAIREAKIAKFGPKENWPDDLQSPVTDGDQPKFADKEGYAGHWIIKASSIEEQRPYVVDKDVQPITDASEFYPGCYAYAAVFANVWEYMGKQGVQFILDGVQKTRDGKSLGGKKPADQVFSPIGSGEISDDADAADDFT